MAKMAVCEIPQVVLFAVRKMGGRMCHGAILVQDINWFPPLEEHWKGIVMIFFPRRDVMAPSLSGNSWAFDSQRMI